VKSYFRSDEEYADFQYALACKPDTGRVVPGAAPIRKMRWSDDRRGRGTRGGLRIIYLHVPEFEVVFLLDVYRKGEVDDLTSVEKRSWQQIARLVIKELKARSTLGLL